MKLRMTIIRRYTVEDGMAAGNTARSAMIKYSPGMDMINSQNRMMNVIRQPAEVTGNRPDDHAETERQADADKADG